MPAGRARPSPPWAPGAAGPAPPPTPGRGCARGAGAANRRRAQPRAAGRRAGARRGGDGLRLLRARPALGARGPPEVAGGGGEGPLAGRRDGAAAAAVSETRRPVVTPAAIQLEV